MAAVRIYRPTKTAMQSGQGGTDHWVVEFEPDGRRFNEPLMGWTGSTDTLPQVRLRFDSREEAIAYAERNGHTYTLIEPHRRRVRPKSYADNFRPNPVE